VLALALVLLELGSWSSVTRHSDVCPSLEQRKKKEKKKKTKKEGSKEEMGFKHTCKQLAKCNPVFVDSSEVDSHTFFIN
jgi:hypothetical protein